MAKAWIKSRRKRKEMKYIVRNFGLFLLVTCFMTSVMAETTIAYVDLERVVNEVQEGASAKEKLKKELDIKQSVFNEKQEKVKKLQESLSKQGAMIKQAAKDKMMEDLQKEGGEMQQMYAKMQQQLVQSQQEIMANILRKTQPIITELAKSGGYTYVLNRNEGPVPTVLYGPPHLDLTNQVIRNYDAANKGQKASKKEAPAKG